MNGTIMKLGKMQEAEYTNFVRVLFGLSSPSPVSENLGDAELEWVNPSLNDSQKYAIKFALASKEIALIHGPPGVSTTDFYLELAGASNFLRPMAYNAVVPNDHLLGDYFTFYTHKMYFRDPENIEVMPRWTYRGAISYEKSY